MAARYFTKVSQGLNLRIGIMAFGIMVFSADSEMEDPLPILLIFIVHVKAPFYC